ncbi:MAG TPA: DNA-3-methyladenine glycosylase [Longimicrobiales bacterium]|nr:DNA-3-methyladenine glycosylase [Longimicrobiales bacterium]
MSTAGIGYEPLPAAFYQRGAEVVARDLLGAVVVSDVGGVRTAGRIVETEAYLGAPDPASHAAERIGRTTRNESMFGAGGIAYVYFIYGMHWCLNAVTGEADVANAVLIRALEPVEGLEAMRERRSHRIGRAPRNRDLLRGPARLAEGLGITGALDGHDLARPPLRIARGDAIPDASIAVGPRIGITRAADWPLRFFLEDSLWVSR